MKKSLLFLILALCANAMFKTNYLIWEQGVCKEDTKHLVLMACHALTFLGFAVSVNFDRYSYSNTCLFSHYHWFISANNLGETL